MQRKQVYERDDKDLQYVRKGREYLVKPRATYYSMVIVRKQNNDNLANKDYKGLVPIPRHVIRVLYAHIDPIAQHIRCLQTKDVNQDKVQVLYESRNEPLVHVLPNVL